MPGLLVLASWTPLVLLSTDGAGLLMLVLLNSSALFAFGWDKVQAQLGRARVPEWALHVAAVLGAAGATAGRVAFRHKTLHPSFSFSAGAGAAALWALVALS